MTNRLVTSSSTLRAMLYLALPVLAEQTLTLTIGYTDWWLTGHYLDGTAPKAAMTLMAYVMWLLPNLFAAVAIGATALVSRHVGAGDSRTAIRAANQAVSSGVVLAVVATVFSLLAAPTFVRIMQLEDEAAQLALSYLWIILPAIPAIMIEEVAAACLRGAGDTVSGLAAKGVVNVVNIVVSSCLVTGYGLFEPLGWTGLAIGTAAGHVVGAVILLTLLIRGRSGLRLRWRRMAPDWHLIRRLLRIGLPGGFDVAAVLFCQFVYLAIINSLGTLSAAAHGLGVQIEAMAYLPGTAFQVAAATMAGQYLGAGNPRRAVRSVLLAFLVGGAVMSAAGLAFYFAGQPLTMFFTGNSDDAARQLTVRLLRVVAVSMPSLAAVMIITGALRGAGDTRWPLLFTLVGLVGVRIPGAMLLALPQVHLPLVDLTIVGYNLGVMGAWYAMVADVVVRSLLVVARFWQGGWMRAKV